MRCFIAVSSLRSGIPASPRTRASSGVMVDVPFDLIFNFGQTCHLGENMKLADLCTAYPVNCDAPAIAHPGAALPLAIRLKIRAQRGLLQSALDRHPQKTAERTGLGLRPYIPGDTLRSLSTRHLLLQDDFQTRIDASPGRFRVSVFVHCYDNMEFRSDEQRPNKMQAAWALAGVIENLHAQQAQKVNIYRIEGSSLSEALLAHRGLLQRSHFSYIITDLLNDPSSKTAAVESLSAALRSLGVRRGMTVVVRDPLEAADGQTEASQSYFSFEPRNSELQKQNDFSSGEYHSGPAYFRNIKEQLALLQNQLQKRGWDSFWCTPEYPFEKILQQLSIRLTGLRIL